MTFWERYRPEELLLFSEQVYWRLFDLHNQAWWPAPIIALLLGGGLILATVRPTPARLRVCLGGLATLWVFVGFAYLNARYATINWAARYAVPLFVVEAVLLVAAALFPGTGRVRDHRRAWPGLVGPGLIVYAVILHPLTALSRETGLSGAEVFGLTPDPLAIATLGTLSLSGNRLPAMALSAAPTIWLLVSATTLFALDSILAWVPLCAVVLAWAALLNPR
ncbi:DUF6064 family protein [Saccharospirillum salsuginis]|uniref:MFS transporter permease n=1 Tax=Saccharospirillum salsuginis TaxID=418750 RepID=A0A918KEM9_9GAMM|nr:DUF6064 family protein [Saccharospirillum salsuginis]GGX60946.1 hypothetical protein GCM10007392_31210 [Saccharospirillum salsuginis]